MKLEFDKYQGAGNDFIIIDGNDLETELSQEQIEYLCDRKFGIGADGLMIIYPSEKNDFEMKYYNSDGIEGSMCGNGGRCIARYAHTQQIADNEMIFKAVDGEHSAVISYDIVSISMNDVKDILEYKDGIFLNTGSPHFVKFVNDIHNLDVYSEGKSISNEERFAPERTNVNFVEIGEEFTKIATFERGVEDETLACGTGAVAAAIAIYSSKQNSELPILLKAKGGNLSVDFSTSDNMYQEIILSGPAEFVFSGIIEIT